MGEKGNAVPPYPSGLSLDYVALKGVGGCFGLLLGGCCVDHLSELCEFVTEPSLNYRMINKQKYLNSFVCYCH